MSFEISVSHPNIGPRSECSQSFVHMDMMPECYQYKLPSSGLGVQGWAMNQRGLARMAGGPGMHALLGVGIAGLQPSPTDRKAAPNMK
jgi:hypothetical protein